jgi:hypothetical protein
MLRVFELCFYVVIVAVIDAYFCVNDADAEISVLSHTWIDCGLRISLKSSRIIAASVALKSGNISLQLVQCCDE